MKTAVKKKLFCLMLLVFFSAWGMEKKALDYDRIVVFGPNLTEILYLLEKGESIAAVDSYTSYPPQVRDLPRCGTLSHPNIEVVLQMEPDLVLIQGDNHFLRSFCAKMNITYKVFRLEGVAGIISGIEEIGDLLGKGEISRDFTRELRLKINRLKDSDQENAPEILLSLGGLNSVLNVTTAGNSTFLGELIELAGGKNVFGDLSPLYPQVSMEEVLIRDPAMIFEILPGRRDDSTAIQQRRDFWKRFSSLQAVKNNNIYYLTQDYLLIPGPRITETYALFKELISLYEQKRSEQ